MLTKLEIGIILEVFNKTSFRVDQFRTHVLPLMTKLEAMLRTMIEKEPKGGNDAK